MPFPHDTEQDAPLCEYCDATDARDHDCCPDCGATGDLEHACDLGGAA